jgi:hypothetical protein
MLTHSFLSLSFSLSFYFREKCLVEAEGERGSAEGFEVAR